MSAHAVGHSKRDHRNQADSLRAFCRLLTITPIVKPDECCWWPTNNRCQCTASSRIYLTRSEVAARHLRSKSRLRRTAPALLRRFCDCHDQAAALSLEEGAATCTQCLVHHPSPTEATLPHGSLDRGLIVSVGLSKRTWMFMVIATSRLACAPKVVLSLRVTKHTNVLLDHHHIRHTASHPRALWQRRPAVPAVTEALSGRSHFKPRPQAMCVSP